MKIFNKIQNTVLTLFVASATLIGCNDDVKQLEFDKDYPTFPQVTPPGDEYAKEGDVCLNVFYLIPMELDTVPNWHLRLSGITKNMQDYIRENFEHAGLGSKTFNLNKNVASEHYIKIHLIRSKVVSVHSSELQMSAIMQEIMKFWNENPETKDGNNTLVYLPKYGGKAPFHGGYRYSSPDRPADLSFGVVTVDHDNFDINFAGSLAGGYFLSDMPAIIHELGHAFWVQHNNTPLSTGDLSLMATVGNHYFDTPRIMRFTPSDLLWMNELDVFRKNEGYEDFTKKYETETVDTAFNFINNQLTVNFKFKSEKKPAFVIVYNDPWFSTNEFDDRASNAYNEYDAVSYPITDVKLENGEYSATTTIDWDDFMLTYNNAVKKGEIRFRVVFEGGNAFPSVVDVKGVDPMISAQRTKFVRFYYNVKNGIPVF